MVFSQWGANFLHLEHTFFCKEMGLITRKHRKSQKLPPWNNGRKSSKCIVLPLRKSSKLALLLAYLCTCCNFFVQTMFFFCDRAAVWRRIREDLSSDIESTDMAVPTQFQAGTSAVPATQVEISVSCRYVEKLSCF